MIILHKKMHKMHLNVLKNIKHSSNLDRLEKDILFFCTKMFCELLNIFKFRCSSFEQSDF